MLEGGAASRLVCPLGGRASDASERSCVQDLLARRLGVLRPSALWAAYSVFSSISRLYTRNHDDISIVRPITVCGDVSIEPTSDQSKSKSGTKLTQPPPRPTNRPLSIVLTRRGPSRLGSPEQDIGITAPSLY